MSAITAAIDVFQGRQADLARKLGVTPQAVNQWVKGRRPVPVRLALAIERETGVSRHRLRPDVFGTEPNEADEGRDGPANTAPRIAQRSQVEIVIAQIDSRMSKRALRARLGLSSDKQLAKVLQLPVEQVEGWEEERALPAVPEVLRLLGVQPEAEPVEQAPEDPDAGRFVPVEVA